MGKSSSQKARVLVVEDEADLSTSLAYALRANGYDVQVAAHGELALRALDVFRPELVLLDIMLPDMSGLEICRKVRSSGEGQQPAVVILSARVQEIDRVVGFEVGADDYVMKPFSMRELMLRIEARLRVRKAATQANAGETSESQGPSFTLCNLQVDEAAHRVFVDDNEVHLSVLEMRVLLYLFKSPGRMCKRGELLTEVWGYHPEVTSRTVDTHVKRLRDKLGSAAELLQTVRGVGFRLARPEDSTAHDRSVATDPAQGPGRRC